MSADRPQLNGVAERGRTLIDRLAKACAFQARVSFKHVPLSAIAPLWPEAHSYAWEVVNRTATSSNPGRKSPYEMWHGEKPPPTMLEWLQPYFTGPRSTEGLTRKQSQDIFLDPQLSIFEPVHVFTLKRASKC